MSAKKSDSIAQALSKLRQEKDMLEKRLIPSKKAHERRMTEISDREKRLKDEIQKSRTSEESRYYEVVATVEIRIAELTRAIAAIEDQTHASVAPLMIQDLAAALLSDDDGEYTAGEIAVKIAPRLGIQSSAHFAQRVLYALRADRRFSYHCSNRKDNQFQGKFSRFDG